MRWYKVSALMGRDLRIFIRSKWKLMEIFYFPVTTVLIWGLFAAYMKSFNMETGLMVLAVNVFWSLSYITQSTTNLNMNEDVWSGSLKQVLSSGVSAMEYIGARIISSLLTAVVVASIMLTTAYYFGLTVIATNFTAVLSITGITLFAAITMSILVAGLMLFLGRSYMFLAWTLLEIFILLSAPFFPLEILPGPVQAVSQAMPFTRIFSSVRGLVETGTVSNQFLLEGFAVILIYTIASVPLYLLGFRHAKKNGELVKMS